MEEPFIRVALDSLGCKLNQAETELLARQFAEAGYRLVPPGDSADVYILNTCTVTHIADRKSRHLLRLARRRNPDARIVATGCYAERAPQELSRIGVDLVLSNIQKSHLLQLVEETDCLHRPACPGLTSRNYDGGRTRTFIKVQDGCHNFCAYCIVPLVRSVEESMSLDRIIAGVRQRESSGYKEVVLTGTEVGSYNYNGVNLKSLLEHILTETAIPRIRLSSLQPQEISPEFIALWRDSRLCPHFHLSLQSGSDGVLRRMKRRYSTADYRQAVSLIRGVVPEAAITTDIIVGFPGETEAEFQESYEFCQKMKFARIHVFPYSPRPGTEAALMPNKIGDKVKRQRSQKMLALAEASARDFRQRFLGKTLVVLWEKLSGNIWSGYTANYIKAYAKTSQDLTNKLLPAKLLEIKDDGVWTELGKSD